MKQYGAGLWLGWLLSGCAAHAPIPATVTPAAPVSHASGNLNKISSVEGLVYQVDAQELVIRSEHAALKFKLPPTADQQVSQGKHLSELHRGDFIRVHISYQDKGMSVDSFDLLPNPHDVHAQHLDLKQGLPLGHPHVLESKPNKGDDHHEKS